MLIHKSQISFDVIGAAMEVHKNIGVGLFESACQECLECELTNRGISFESQVPVPLIYKEVALKCGYRADLVVEGLLVVEIKSIEKMLPVHDSQVLTYMRLLRKEEGLLINFNVPVLKQGIRRFLLDGKKSPAESDLG